MYLIEFKEIDILLVIGLSMQNIILFLIEIKRDDFFNQKIIYRNMF